MRVAIPIWGDLVSPVLDTAGRLLAVDLVEGRMDGRDEVPLVGRSTSERADTIVALDPDVLSCVAVSRGLEARLTNSGVVVLPWIVGRVDDVLGAFEEGELRGTRSGCQGAQTGRGTVSGCEFTARTLSREGRLQMRVGIPIRGDRIPPGLDTAERLLVVDSGEGGVEQGDTPISWPSS